MVASSFYYYTARAVYSAVLPPSLMVCCIMEDMFTRVHYIFFRDFPKGWLRVTLKGIWCHREHSVKSKRTLYSFISFRFVKLLLPRGHKSRRRKCFPENRRTQLQVYVFFLSFHLPFTCIYVCWKILHHFVKDQELGLDLRIISPSRFTVLRTSSHPCISTK